MEAVSRETCSSQHALCVLIPCVGDGEACANEVELQKDWGTSARQGELIVEKRKWDAVSECVIQAKYSRTSHAFLKGHSR